jgi:hypothetical protein
MHLLTNEGTLEWWLGKGVIEIGPGLTGFYPEILHAGIKERLHQYVQVQRQ